MAFVGMGFGLGVVAAAIAFLSGASVAVIVLSYIGTGVAVLLSAIVSAMMIEETSGIVEEDPMLVPHR